jgi:hypothetical protein
METLNRQEIEDLIVDLFYNQKKTYREIQKIVRKSPRDIKAILNNVDPGRSSLSTSSQAYKLFSEDKTPNEVAIRLNIREPDATQFYREYWRLNQLYELDQIYQETKGNFSSFIELYRQMKTTGMNVAHVIRLLRVANNDIPSVEDRCQELRREEASLNARNMNATRASEQLSNEILEKHGTLNRFRLSCSEESLKLARIRIQKVNLEDTIKQFQNSNKEYLKVKEISKQKVEHALGYRRQLLKDAYLSVIDACLNDPVKFKVLFYNMPPITNATSVTSTTVTLPVLSDQSNLSNDELSVDLQSQYPYVYEKSLLDEAERFYNKRVEKLTQKCLDQITSENSISPSISMQSPANSYLYSKEMLSASTYMRAEEYTTTRTESQY